jgi:hypothetical protein
MKLGVQTHNIETDDGDEVGVTLWVTPEGELSIGIEYERSDMDLDSALEVATKIRQLAKLPTTNAGAKLVEKMRVQAYESMRRVEHRLAAKKGGV